MGIEIESEGDGNFIKFQLLQKKYFDQEFSSKIPQKSFEARTETSSRRREWGTEKRLFCCSRIKGTQGSIWPLFRQTDRQT